MDRERMTALVDEWDSAVVAASDAAGWWKVAGRDRRSSVLRAPADPESIQMLEERIGRGLPPSYRWFAGRSNGADAATGQVSRPGEGLLAVEQVDWFVRVEPLMPHLQPEAPPKGRRAWEDPYCDPVDELEWLTGRFLAASWAPTLPGHLTHCLAVSPMEDKSAVLLNPLVRDVDGEWECWDFYTHDLPSGLRSFGEYLAARRDVLRRNTDRFEGLDLDGVDDIDDATLERWLTTWAVAPPWLAEQIAGADPPGRLVDLLGRLVDADPSRHARMVAKMHSPAALDLARRAWTATAGTSAGRKLRLRRVLIDPAAPLEREQFDVLRRLAWSRDPGVLAWVVDLMAELLAADPGLTRRLTPMNGTVLERLWHRTGSEMILVQMTGSSSWLGVDDKRWAVDALLEGLHDPDWRATHREHLSDVIHAVASTDPHSLSVLRGLRGAPDVPAERLAIALLRHGELDLDFAAAHLPIRTANRVDLPDEFRRAHRRRRVDRVATPTSTTTLVDLVAALAAHTDTEATELLVTMRGRINDVHLIRAFERQRTDAAADALVRLASDQPLAWRALARLGDIRALGPLVALLDHPQPEAQLFAARGLRELDHTDGIAALLDTARTHADTEVELVAAHAAATSPGVDAMDLLNRLARADDDRARLAAHWKRPSEPVSP